MLRLAALKTLRSLALLGVCSLAGRGQAALQAGELKSIPNSSPGFERVTNPPANEHSDCLGIPGEFEKQAGMVLSWKAGEVPVIGTLLEIAQIASKTAPVVVLVSSDLERLHAETAFHAARIPQGQVHFLKAPVNTIWARDFGPMIVRHADGSVHFVDCDYDDGDRPEDDNIPPVLANVMGAKCVRSLLTIEGGNLLSNGAGLCITTSKTVADNVIRGYEDCQVMPLCETIFQCQEVAVLEPLVGEPTGHVDMFATFTSSDTVVVGSMDPAIDPVNAGVLDRNAKKLAEVWTPNGSLHVERIPMPAPSEGLWRSFTNVSYFNGVLMMPTYAGVDPILQRDAAETYRRLLPGWEIQGIDCTKLIRLGGAVHCVTLNLPSTRKSENQTQRPARPQSQFSLPGGPMDEPKFDRSQRQVTPTMFMPEDAPTFAPIRPFEADDNAERRLRSW